MSNPPSTPQVPLIPSEMYHALVVAHDEIARLRLTEAERDAIAEMALVCDGREKRSLEWQLSDEAAHWRGKAETLRGVMDRMQ